LNVISLIIVDCDGVLFDSRPANVAFHNSVLTELGCPPLDADGENLAHFMAATQLYDELFEAGSSLRKKASEIARQTDYGPYYELMQPAEGLFELLADLKRDYRLAMASNRSRTAQGVVEVFRLEALLDFVVGAHQVEHPKPAPDMLELCMRELAATADTTLYVGDAVTDREAATAAGVHYIGVGRHSGDNGAMEEIGELRARLVRE
jgi:HAD superfamily hydrolase (TIGR01549 family)